MVLLFFSCKKHAIDRLLKWELCVKISEESASKKCNLANGELAHHSEQVKLMEQEIREQEKLLAGYQQENERIYQVCAIIYHWLY